MNFPDGVVLAEVEDFGGLFEVAMVDGVAGAVGLDDPEFKTAWLSVYIFDFGHEEVEVPPLGGLYLLVLLPGPEFKQDEFDICLVVADDDCIDENSLGFYL